MSYTLYPYNITLFTFDLRTLYFVTRLTPFSHRTKFIFVIILLFFWTCVLFLDGCFSFYWIILLNIYILLPLLVMCYPTLTKNIILTKFNYSLGRNKNCHKKLQQSCWSIMGVTVVQWLEHFTSKSTGFDSVAMVYIIMVAKSQNRFEV